MFGRRKKYCRHSDEELMRFSSNGEEKAFEEIYDRYAGRLFTYFCRMLHNDRNKAEDFVQDLFAKIIHRPEVYNAERPFKTWLFSVANNMCKNEYRRLAVRKNSNYSLDNGLEVAIGRGTEAEQKFDDSVFKDALQQALNGLDDKQRQAFVMRYDQELSIKEIAAVFECSEGTIKSRLFYTLRKLSVELKEFKPNEIIR